MIQQSIIGPSAIMMAAFLWALDALIHTPLTQHIPAASIVLYEHVFGLLLLSPLFIKSLSILKKISLQTWVHIMILTLVSSVGGTILFTQALGASFSTGDFITPLLLQKLQPVIVILLSILFLKEKPHKEFYLFAPLAIIGGYLMSFGFMAPSLSFSGKELVVLLSLGATSCWGIGTIISKHLLTKLSTRDTTFLRFLVAIPFSFITTLLLNQTFSVTQFSVDDTLRFATIALSTGAVGLLIYYFGLKKTPAHISTIAELVFPFTSILIGVTSLNPYGAAQTLSYVQIIGIVLLLISIIKISLISQKKRADITIAGTVVHGAGDGKKLGFPTANIELLAALPLEYGVYACKITIDTTVHDAVLSYGPRMVFGETVPLFEVHIFDFKKNIYGKNVTVEILDFIRKTQPFSSVKLLVKQIEKDCNVARQLLKNTA